MAAQKLVIIDGYGLFFRAYFATAKSHLTTPGNHNGAPSSAPATASHALTSTGALHAFAHSLLKLVTDGVLCAGQPILVALDRAGKDSPRHQLYPQYKAHRKELPAELCEQLAIFPQLLEAFGLPHIAHQGAEADDIIATYAKMAIAQGCSQVHIISSDKDLMQLVEDGSVVIYDYINEKNIDSEAIVKKMGVLPTQIVDYLALIGDSSDNIPGVRGIGQKGATKLLQQFGSLENIYANIEDIPGKTKLMLEVERENAFLSYKLASLNYELPTPYSLEQLVWPGLSARSNEIMTFLEFFSLKRVINQFSRTVERLQGHNKAISSTSASLTSEIGAGDDVLTASKASTADKEPSAINSDTYAYSPQALFKNAVLKRYICIYLDKSQKKSLKIFAGLPGNWYSAALEDGANSLDATIKELLERTDIIKICVNCEDIYTILRNHGVNLQSYDDIGMLAYSLEAGRLDYSDIAQLLMEFGAVHSQGNLDIIMANPGLIIEQIKHCYDSIMTKLTQQKRLSLYLRLDREVLYRLRQMEINGVAVDTEYLKQLKDEFSLKLNQISEKIFDESRMQFNIASPKQVAEVLYNEMKLGTYLEAYVKRGFISRSKSNSTASEILEILAAQGFTIAENILEWRQYAKLLGTYVEGLLKSTNPDDGRIHCQFHSALTTTGRISASEPNLQSIPIRGKEGAKLRRVFLARPGFMLISADYAQIEMRLLAHIGQIDSLKQMFATGQDIHRVTASEVFKVPLAEVTPTLRSRAKAINFGIIYGISGFGLARNLGIDIREAQDYIQKYLATHPGIEEYMEKTLEFAHTNGYVETLLGHHCHIKNIDSSNKVLRQMAERTAINAPIQGSAADIIRKVIASLPEDLMPYLGLQIHDELLFEVPELQAAELAVRIKEAMLLKNLALEVPLETEVRIGKTWDFQ